MLNELENIAETDPLANPEQRAAIDHILAQNKDVPGATMVVLNGQERLHRPGHSDLQRATVRAERLQWHAADGRDRAEVAHGHEAQPWADGGQVGRLAVHGDLFPGQLRGEHGQVAATVRVEYVKANRGE